MMVPRVRGGARPHGALAGIAMRLGRHALLLLLLLLRRHPRHHCSLLLMLLLLELPGEVLVRLLDHVELLLELPRELLVAREL